MNNPNPIDVYTGLRETALKGVKDMAKPPTEHADVYGMVIDIPQGGGYVTLVAMSDTSTSMYVSNGGGIIGAGQKYPAVAHASRAVLVRAQHCLSNFVAETSNNLPPPGIVRFYLLTETEKRCLDISEDQFWGKSTITGKQFPMIMAVQQLIHALQSTGA